MDCERGNAAVQLVTSSGVAILDCFIKFHRFFSQYVEYHSRNALESIETSFSKLFSIPAKLILTVPFVAVPNFDPGHVDTFLDIKNSKQPSLPPV